jgi:thiol:disulfide interchange protein DsbD
MTPQVKRVLSPVSAIAAAVCIALLARSLPARGELLAPAQLFGSSTETEITLDVAGKTQDCIDANGCFRTLLKAKPLILAAREGTSASDAGGPLSKLRALAAGGDAEEEFLPMDKAFKVDVKVKDAHTLVASFSPADSYYLYRDKIGFATSGAPGIAIAKVELPPGEKKSDPTFGDTEVFHRPFQAVITLDRSTVRDATRMSIDARYQGCSEKGLCYPPAKKRFDLTLAAWSRSEDGAGAAAPKARSAQVESSVAATPPAASREQTQPSSGPASSLDGGDAKQARNLLLGHSEARESVDEFD